jgi:plastocyanin
MNSVTRYALAVWLGCAAAAPAAAATLTVDFSDKGGAPLADAVVYATPVNGTVPAKPPGTAIIDQIHRQYEPKVTILQTGTSVSFPNKDNIEHDVYSFSPAKTFELKLYSGVPAHPVVFDKPGLVVLGCNIHDQMIAYVLVVDTPYFGKADAKGVARIEGLPPGDYTVKAWHYKMPDGAAHPAQHVNPGADQTVRFQLDVSGS